MPFVSAAGGRRFIARNTSSRLSAGGLGGYFGARLGRYLADRARDLMLDPGVLCPNTALEAIAFEDPENAEGVAQLPEVKPWFARSFGDEVIEALQGADALAAAGGT